MISLLFSQNVLHNPVRGILGDVEREVSSAGDKTGSTWGTSLTDYHDALVTKLKGEQVFVLIIIHFRCFKLIVFNIKKILIL